MSWTTSKEELEGLANEIVKGVRLRTTDYWLFTVLAYLKAIITLGIWSVSDSKKYTAMALFKTVCIPEKWSYHSAIDIIPHECQHIKHAKTIGVGSTIIGTPIYWILYGLVFLPLGLALFRAWAEADCWATQLEVRGEKVTKKTIEHHCDELAGVETFFSCPRFISRPILKWKFRKLL